jgi:hypothetical protein
MSPSQIKSAIAIGTAAALVSACATNIATSKASNTGDKIVISTTAAPVATPSQRAPAASPSPSIARTASVSNPTTIVSPARDEGKAFEPKRTYLTRADWAALAVRMADRVVAKQVSGDLHVRLTDSQTPSVFEREIRDLLVVNLSDHGFLFTADQQAPLSIDFAGGLSTKPNAVVDSRLLLTDRGDVVLAALESDRVRSSDIPLYARASDVPASPAAHRNSAAVTFNIIGPNQHEQ